MPSPEYQAHHRRAHETARQTPRRQPPPILLLPRARIHPHHEPDDIGAAGDVEDLEHEVPHRPPRRHPEEIEVAREKDEGVEELREERDSFGGSVAVDGPDEDAHRCRVRDVAEDAEHVHIERHGVVVGGRVSERAEERDGNGVLMGGVRSLPPSPMRRQACSTAETVCGREVNVTASSRLYC